MRINLDFGHTLRGADTGAEGCGRKEQDCTREIGYKVKAKLEALGHTVNVCSVDSASSVNESLNKRVSHANNFGGDIYISIHLNSSNPAGEGCEVYTYKGKEIAIARNILNNICELGFKNRGIRSNELYVINHTSMTAILIECCFINSEKDMSKYNAENFANAIVKGILGQTIKSEDISSLGSASGIYNYEQHGEAKVIVDTLNVRVSPSISAEKVAEYHRGEIIHEYDRVFENDGFRWIRYKADSGNYRYVAVRKLSTNEKYAECY